MTDTVRKIPAIPFAVAGVLGIAFCFFPLFRIVPLKRDSGAPAAPVAGASFDAAAFAKKFWSEKLPPAARRATAASTVLAAIRRDPAAAAQQHAHQVGLGGAAFYFIRGAGRVTAVEKNSVLLDLEGATIALGTGPLFGNTVRDGTGLLNVNDFPGLTEFNALSAELNRLVEEQVLPALRTRARVGAVLAFAGCAEAPESVESGPLLVVVPVEVAAAP